MALVKQGKTYFFKSSQTSRERRFGCLCNQVLPKTLRFSLQRHKTAKSYAFCDCTPVDALGCFFVYGTGNLFSNSAQAEFGGFGLRLLVSNGFLGAKAPLDPQSRAFLI